MRVLVHAGSLDAARRMRFAAMGLARRGHEVLWHGARPVEGGALSTAPAGLRLARVHADVVLGGGAAPTAVATAGRLAGARCQVLDVAANAPARWSLLGRAAWDAVYAAALLEPAEAATARERLPASMLERAALWSDAAPATDDDPGHPDVEVLERACERALARQRGLAPRAAVFLDRDGTLIEERGYLDDPDGVTLLPGVSAALKRLRAAGFALIVVSNQSGVGRGTFTLARAHEVMARLRHVLRAEGIELDGIYLCPHRPDEGCPCRKPGAALLERAAEDHLISLTRSVMVGDKRLDARAGQAAGGSGILLRTGYGGDERDAADHGTPDAVCETLADAARWIAERGDALAV